MHKSDTPPARSFVYSGGTSLRNSTLITAIIKSPGFGLF